MVRKKNRRAKVDLDEEDKAEDAGKSSSFVVLLSSSDDEDANEDLSLKIVEKALMKRAAKQSSEDTILAETKVSSGGGGSSGVVALSSSSALEEEVVEVRGGVGDSDIIVGSGTGDLGNKKAVRRKKKIKKMEVGEQSVIVIKDEKREEMVETEEPTSIEVTDNIVFRKLLRGPRYFDPPDNSWGACFNCGEEGHTMANCSAVKRNKPCFVCGSLEHSAKQCSKGKDCFICKKGGHRAKDCPEKYKGSSSSLRVCLKCGDSGHDMFSCQSDYLPDDLKGVQCYMCKRFGHLCCVGSIDSSPRMISCYKCGQLGHTGLACSKIRGDDTGLGSSSTCYRCGEEGHFARECRNARKKSHEFSTPPLRSHREDKDYSGFQSVPLDLRKTRKRKKTRKEEKGFTTPQKSKHRGGWIVEDPGDFSNGKSKRRSWRSPSSSSRSSKKSSKVYSGSSRSQGSSKGFQHRFSAARFGNSGSEGIQRNYNWW